MKVTPSAIADVLVIEPAVYGDERGFFLETFNPRIKAAIGGADFIQDNYSRSSKDVLRGLHYQLTKPQGKLIRVLSGKILDVAVDIRRNSPTFGKAVAAELAAETHQMLWIPAGFAHGFLTLSASADVLYKVTTPYDPKDERTILWNDPALGIQWPSSGEPIISGRDRAGKLLRDAELL